MVRYYKVKYREPLEDFSSVWNREKRQIKNEFIASSKTFSRQDFAFFSVAFKLYLKKGNDPLKVVNLKTNEAGVIIVDSFKQHIYFYIYDIDKETMIFDADLPEKIGYILSGKNIPDDYITLIEAKREVLDKKAILKGIFTVFAFLVLILVVIMAKPYLTAKKAREILPQPIAPKPEKITLTKEEMDNLGRTVRHKALQKAKDVIEAIIEDEGYRIDSITVKIDFEQNPEKLTGGYTVEVMKKYPYPVVNSRKAGNDEYAVTESISDTFDGKKIPVSSYEIETDMCIKKLLMAGFEVTERKDKSVTFESWGRKPGDLSLRSVLLFFDFLDNLQKTCGYRISARSFGIRNKEVYVEGFTLDLD